MKSNPGLSEFIEFSSDNKSILVKLRSGDIIRYSIPSGDMIDINKNARISQAMNIKSLDLLSYGPGIQNPKLWLLTYYNLYFNKHENISKINTTFTNLKFSVVHFMTMLGEKNVIEKFIKNGELLLLLDAYGHSPIYYPIKFKHQEITDIYINYILEVLEKEPNSFKLSILLESIQNDLATIIINASPNLDIFLSSTFLNQKTPVYFGNPNDYFPIIEISKFTSMGFDEFSSQ